MTKTTLQAGTKKKKACPKKGYQKVNFGLKLAVIDRIQTGQISLNHASKVYRISRSSINYWMKKLSTFSQINIGVSKKDEIKKLKQRIEELEFRRVLFRSLQLFNAKLKFFNFVFFTHACIYL